MAFFIKKDSSDSFDLFRWYTFEGRETVHKNNIEDGVTIDPTKVRRSYSTLPEAQAAVEDFGLTNVIVVEE